MILILDFGSQYTQLIARKIRELSVYSVIYPYNFDIENIRAMKPDGIILSGGPSSCVNENAPYISEEIFELGIPVLGICYGFQVMCKLLGSTIVPGQIREYGRMVVDKCDHHFPLWDNLGDKSITVWMSHGDTIKTLPDGFINAGNSSGDAHIAAAWDIDRNLYGLQFHPEVYHTDYGIEMLSNFVLRICEAYPNWTPSSFIRDQIEYIDGVVGIDERVICGLSGGVDSAVAATLVYKVIGSRLNCIFVDNGLLRDGEVDRVIEVFSELPLTIVDASQRFLNRLADVIDPEEKRKIIGHEFIRVFEEEAEKLGGADYLLQGTLYPDIIESRSVSGPSSMIKSHHNVGGLPEEMNFRLILEPLKELFKDEVRKIGAELGLPDHILYRHPFPGPGLAIRVVGSSITPEKLEILRQADSIIEEEFENVEQYNSVWQAFAVLLPFRSVGIMGDERTYGNTICLRVVNSTDGMTCSFARVSYNLLDYISNRITNEIPGVNRVLYDISSKPPATIEFE
jgi:GMP synthase (glutamine-hydrolysing)